MKYDIMSQAHRRAKNLRKSGDKRKYRVILSSCLKAVNMYYRECTNEDINYLKATFLNVNLKLLQSFHQENTYDINFQNDGKIVVGHKNPYFVHGRKIYRSNFN